MVKKGYITCPLAPETYIICDKKCEKCEYNIEFEKALKERSK